MATVAVLPASLPASAATLQTWKAKVVQVNDGDTFDADIFGDGTRDERRVRMLGIQAMELTNYSTRTGYCHSREAYLRLRYLIEGKTVRLRALHEDSTGHAKRLHRYVEVYRNGAWRDVNKILLDEGHVLWFPNRAEWRRNLSYYHAAQRARAAKRNLWDTDFRGGRCSYGPQQGARLQMWVQWDADGNDNKNLNQEFVKIKNVGTSDVRVGGWQVRDSALLLAGGGLRQYTFPSGATIPAGRSVFLHVGSGTNKPNAHYYWNLDSAQFENVDYGISLGDGGYLFDPDGDLRAHFIYPCFPRAGCTDAARGKLQVSKLEGEPAGNEGTDPNLEYVEITNTDTVQWQLEGYLLESYPYSYEFGPGDVLAAGQTLRLHVGKGSSGVEDGVLIRHWGHSTSMFNSTGDWARLKTFQDVAVDCLAYKITCGQIP